MSDSVQHAARASTVLGTFYGVGVGPGPAGMIPVAAWDALRGADVVFAPRARGAEGSVARQCLQGLDLPEERFRDVEFTMDPDRRVLASHYGALAAGIARELRAGRTVAYLTIGDSLTYSTYGYTLAAVLDVLPGVPHRTFPGVTSFAAAAAALGWPLGEGKERTLVLPCPDDMAALEDDVRTHDVVVLMKIGARLPAVLALLARLGIAEHCAFARRIGLPGEVLHRDASRVDAERESGYLATMLIRRAPREVRHRTTEPA